MHLFQSWQMQKIEQVYLDTVLTLPASQSLYFFFKNAIYLTNDDIVMIGLGFAGHVFFGLWPPGGRQLVGPYMIKKHNILDKNTIWPIKTGAFGDEELLKSTPGASNHHKRLVFDVLMKICWHPSKKWSTNCFAYIKRCRMMRWFRIWCRILLILLIWLFVGTYFVFISVI